jgi:hypothetical protein
VLVLALSTTAGIAPYAAVVGTVALVNQVLHEWRSWATRVEVKLSRQSIVSPHLEGAQEAIVFEPINHSEHPVTIRHLGLAPLREGGQASFFPTPLPRTEPGPFGIPARDAVTVYQPPESLGPADPNYTTRARVRTSDGKMFRSKPVRVGELLEPLPRTRNGSPSYRHNLRQTPARAGVRPTVMLSRSAVTEPITRSMVGQIVQLLDLDLPVIPDSGPVVEESLHSLGARVDQLLGPTGISRYVQDEVGPCGVRRELPGLSDAFDATANCLHIVLSHRLPPLLDEPFGGSAGLVDVEIEREQFKEAIPPGPDARVAERNQAAAAPRSSALVGDTEDHAIAQVA